MIIDTSALLAILQDEPERRNFNEIIAAKDQRSISVASFVEISIIVEARFASEGIRDLDHFITAARIDIIPVDLDQGRLAREAYRLYGKGRHPAGLNFGDCFSYALAKSSARPLLYKGKDFSQTDIESAVS